jgi:hypothetical protein
MDKFLKSVTPSEKQRLSEIDEERRAERLQRFSERDSEIREHREEAAKEAAREAPPKIRKKPGPKPKTPVSCAPCSPDDPSPYEIQRYRESPKLSTVDH